MCLGQPDDAAAWKELVNRRVSEQLAGKKPPGVASWEEYWTGWYDGIRHFRGLPFAGSKFDTRDKMLRYIKQQLKSHRLPTYEQT